MNVTPDTKESLDEQIRNVQIILEGAEPPTMYLCPPCHLRTPMRMFKEARGRIWLRCASPSADCYLSAATVVVPKKTILYEATWTDENKGRLVVLCHPEEKHTIQEVKRGSVRATYTYGTGVITVNCYKCDEKVAELFLS